MSPLGPPPFYRGRDEADKIRDVLVNARSESCWRLCPLQCGAPHHPGRLCQPPEWLEKAIRFAAEHAEAEYRTDLGLERAADRRRARGERA